MPHSIDNQHIDTCDINLIRTLITNPHQDCLTHQCMGTKELLPCVIVSLQKGYLFNKSPHQSLCAASELNKHWAEGKERWTYTQTPHHGWQEEFHLSLTDSLDLFRLQHLVCPEDLTKSEDPSPGPAAYLPFVVLVSTPGVICYLGSVLVHSIKCTRAPYLHLFVQSNK